VRKEQSMRRSVVGILAHVDAGKTTLSEAMPDFETVYLTQDQKGNKRTAAIMGAYVGE